MVKRILVVDDDSHQREYLAQYLKQKGYSVSVASDGVQCIEELEKEIPDLIIMDCLMPRMNGIDTYNKIIKNEHTKNVPVLFMSSESIKSFKYEFLQKPFSLSVMLLKVQQILSTENKKNL